MSPRFTACPSLTRRSRTVPVCEILTLMTPSRGVRKPLTRAFLVYSPQTRKPAVAAVMHTAINVRSEKEIGLMRTIFPSHSVRRCSMTSGRNSDMAQLSLGTARLEILRVEYSPRPHDRLACALHQRTSGDNHEEAFATRDRTSRRRRRAAAGRFDAAASEPVRPDSRPSARHAEQP